MGHYTLPLYLPKCSQQSVQWKLKILRLHYATIKQQSCNYFDTCPQLLASWHAFAIIIALRIMHSSAAHLCVECNKCTSTELHYPYKWQLWSRSGAVNYIHANTLSNNIVFQRATSMLASRGGRNRNSVSNPRFCPFNSSERAARQQTN